MWSPVRISMRNLFSHVESNYEFTPGTCTVIFGRNDTDRNFENNGAGKTTLFEAVCIALTGDSLRKIDKENFINYEAQSCEIDFELYNAVMKMSMRIVRTYYRGSKTGTVKLYENGSQNVQMTSVAETNKRILELLGISRDDLLRYYIISQDNKYTFFTAGDVEKKEIMNRITSADMVLPVIAHIDERLKELSSEYDDKNTEIMRLDERAETLREQLAELESSLGDPDGAEETEIREKIERHRGEIKQNDKEIKQIQVVISQQEKKASNMGNPAERATAWRDKAYAKQKEIRAVRKTIEEADGIIDRIDVQLGNEITCPSCGEVFVPGSDLSIDELVALRESTETERSKHQSLLQKKQKNYSLYMKNAEAEEEKSSELLTIREMISKNRAKISSIKGDTEYHTGKIRSLEEQLKGIAKGKEALESQRKSLEEKIAEATKASLDLQDTVDPIEEEMNELRYWKVNMGRGGFQTYLANKSVKIIEGATNSYLRKFGVDLSVNINGFRVLKSGEVREKIDIFVSNDGVEWNAFMAKSGGERGRIMMAGVLGIQRLINMSTDGRGLDLLLADECFHGMDTRGQENIIKIFERLGSTIMMITQDVSDSFNNENTLYVVKTEGESHYVSIDKVK